MIVYEEPDIQEHPPEGEPDYLNTEMCSTDPPSRHTDWRAFLEYRRNFRRTTRKAASRIGFSLCLLWLVMQGIMTAMTFLGSRIEDVIGVDAPLMVFLNQTLFSMSGQGLVSYAAAIPLMLLVLRRLPEKKIEPKKMRIRKFILFLVLAMGIGYALNLVSMTINLMIQAMMGDGSGGVNPVEDVLNEMNVGTMLYVAFIAPYIEELIFRKILLDRIRPFGDKAAILFTAILFGLMHGNLSQLLYATGIGIILGYVAVKTGRIYYSVLLHMIINGSSVLLTILMMVLVGPLEGLYFPLTAVVGLSVIFLIIAAFINILLYRKKTKLSRGDLPVGIEYRDFSFTLYLNAGVFLFIVINMFTTIIYAFFM